MILQTNNPSLALLSVLAGRNRLLPKVVKVVNLFNEWERSGRMDNETKISYFCDLDMLCTLREPGVRIQLEIQKTVVFSK